MMAKLRQNALEAIEARGFDLKMEIRKLNRTKKKFVDRDKFFPLPHHHVTSDNDSHGKHLNALTKASEVNDIKGYVDSWTLLNKLVA